MTETRKLRVFLCHSSQDKPIVRELYQRLNAEGWIDPWLDEEKLLPGQDWDLEIEKAVRATDAVIVCLSTNSVDKEGYIQREIRLVLRAAGYKPENTIFLIPIRLNACAIPMRLELQHYVDFYPLDRREWTYSRILQALKSRLEQVEEDEAEQRARKQREEDEQQEIAKRVRREADDLARKEGRLYDFEYLEIGKFFRDGISSDFNNLAFTTGMPKSSQDLRNATSLDLRTSFSAKSGNVSAAFLPVLGGSRYAFVQFQSRYENEFGNSSTNRPFFQTRFLLLSVADWKNLFSLDLTILPSLLNNHNSDFSDHLDNFYHISGDIGNSLKVPILKPDSSNNLFVRYMSNSNQDERRWIISVVSTILKFRETGMINIRYEVPLWDKLILMDAVSRMLLLVLEKPISFAFEASCSALVDVRFGMDVRGFRPVYVLDASDTSTWYSDEVISDAFDLFVNQNANFQLNTYQDDPFITKLGRGTGDRNAHIAFRFIASKSTGDFLKWFLESDGQYDEKIIPNLNSKHIQNILRNGPKEKCFRLLDNLARVSPVGDWFTYLVQSHLPLQFLQELLDHFFESQSEFGDVVIYLSNMTKIERRTFLTETQDLLYDAIKHHAEVDGTFGSRNIEVADYIISTIESLPKSYQKAKELWFWINCCLPELDSQTISLYEIFEKFNIDSKHFSSLYHVAFLETNGDYDTEILSKLSPENFQDILLHESPANKFRLLTKAVNLISLEDWFTYVQQSLLNPKLLNDLFAVYTKSLGSSKSLIVYFASLKQSERKKYQIESQDLLYKAIKDFAKTDFSFGQEYIRSVKGIVVSTKLLPPTYSQDEEMWFWVNRQLPGLYEQVHSLAESFMQIELDPREFPSLFYRALMELVIGKNNKIASSDMLLINTFANEQLPEYVKLQASIISVQDSRMPVVMASGLVKEDNRKGQSYLANQEGKSKADPENVGPAVVEKTGNGIRIPEKANTAQIGTTLQQKTQIKRIKPISTWSIGCLSLIVVGLIFIIIRVGNLILSSATLSPSTIPSNTLIPTLVQTEDALSAYPLTSDAATIFADPSATSTPIVAWTEEALTAYPLTSDAATNYARPSATSTPIVVWTEAALTVYLLTSDAATNYARPSATSTPIVAWTEEALTAYPLTLDASGATAASALTQVYNTPPTNVPPSSSPSDNVSSIGLVVVMISLVLIVILTRLLRGGTVR